MGVLSQQGTPKARESWEAAAQILLWIWVGKWQACRSQGESATAPHRLPFQWLGNSGWKCKYTKERKASVTGEVDLNYRNKWDYGNFGNLDKRVGL